MEPNYTSSTQDETYILILASQNGHCDLVRQLLERGADVNAAKQNGGTALILASHKGYSDVVKLLLEWGAEVNAAMHNGCTALMATCWNGHCNVVRLLLERGADVNAVKEDGETALILARFHCDVMKLLLERGAEVNAATLGGLTALILTSQNGNCDIVRLLLKREADVNAATLEGCTALMVASQNGHCDVVTMLLQRKAEVNTIAQDGSTALILASNAGHYDVVRLLLEMEAEVNKDGEQNGWTALMCASQNCHYNIVRLLLERKAEVNASLDDGRTALMLASQEGHCDVVKLLLERGVEVNAVEQGGGSAIIGASRNGHCDVVRLLLENKAEVNVATRPGWTALMVASRNGSCNVVRLLLEKGADVNACEEGCHTALMVASEHGHCDIVRLLLDSGAEVNLVLHDCRTALMLASHNGHYDIVKLLLVAGSEVNKVGEDGGTALILATENGYYDIVKLLVDNEAEVNRIGQYCYTALIVASDEGHCDVVRLLLDAKADINIAGVDDYTALILASQQGHSDIVRPLLEREAEVNAVTYNGYTALMLASQNGHCDVVRLLLESKAEVNTVDQGGETALMLASENGCSGAVELLLDRKAEVNTIAHLGWTALMLASQNGHYGVVRLLLGRGADVNIVGQEGRNALMAASQNGHSDVVRLLLDREAKVNATKKNGVTALMRASQNGHCDVVRLLLNRESKVNAAKQNGVTALMRACKNGHSDVVSLLLEREAEVNASAIDGRTPVLLASQKGQWNTAKQLIDAGANLSHYNKHGESAAMYITFAGIANKCSTELEESVKDIWKNPVSPKSHYGMSIASFALVEALLHNTTNEWFNCYFAKSALQEDVLYAFLPNLLQDYREPEGYIFGPYRGVEGKICLHTLATAVVCKLPLTDLPFLTTHTRDSMVNMLGQTPLHLLAMEDHILEDLEEKISFLTEAVGFSFTDIDNNGRVAYHIACLCHNTQFLFCGLKLDSNITTNMLVQDHLGKTPLVYMTYLLYNTNESLGIPSPKLQSARKTLRIISQSIGADLADNTELKACTSHKLSNSNVDSLRRYFKTTKTVAELSEMTNTAKKFFFGTDDVASLFTCSARGIGNMSEKHHIILSVIHLLQLTGTAMGQIDPLFECVPEMKGSVLEYTKCGELDELDMSMKLVNFTAYFTMQIHDDGIETSANIAPLCNRYWICGQIGMFSSVEFCADFWQIFLKALDTEAIHAYAKINHLVLENCIRKHGFVGMLSISCQVGGSIHLISVDIAPCIVTDKLKRYIALLRPRHHGNKEIGRDFLRGLELSSSQTDWDFLKFLPSEVMCGYALVKLVRSVADTFQTREGKVYTAEDILPSYMVKVALLWILDPEDKRSKIYKTLNINSIFHSEDSSLYKDNVLGLCQYLLQNSETSGFDSVDFKLLLDICEKCTTGVVLTARERILPYVLATRHSDRQQQNGISVQWMLENWKPGGEGKSHGDEIIYSRKFYTTLEEAERVRMELKNRNKSVVELSYHKIAYPDISEEIAGKCQVWAIRMLRILPHLLHYKGLTADGKTTITGVRNYYLPDQEIFSRDNDLTVALCRVLETVLEPVLDSGY